ncbi:MAG TPA: pentapeptide repeat-containing protein [Verrucomicrobiae bacterium]|nr:pentapeptide repeat-containing protein [Verrucomicrobiae bacterium]
MLAQVAAGKSADLGSQFSDETNRVLRAAFLEALLTQGGTNVHRNGVSIEHAVLLEGVDLRNAEVGHETSLIECRFAGDANFSKSVFEKNFTLTGSTFQAAVDFSSVKVKRSVNFDSARFGAEVKAARTEVIGVFSAREAHFNSSTGLVNFTSLKTGGDVQMTGATFAGPVTFQSAHIGENWGLDGCLFTNQTALIKFEEVNVEGATSFVACRFDGYVSFRDARFLSIDFSRITWPVRLDDGPCLWLNGMTYGRIKAGSDTDSWQNIYSLVQRTARGSAYSADVFTRLEGYYRQLGYPRPANVFFRAQKKREREEVLTGLAWGWSFFLDQFVGYGRSPERAIFWSVIIIAIGCAVFQPQRMEAQKSEFTERKYSSFWYSVDVYLPIIKLHDAEIWKPKEDQVLTNVWRRIHTILGWALIPIALAAWTGMLSH